MIACRAPGRFGRRARPILLRCLLLLALLPWPGGAGATADDAAAGGVTGLPLPRYVSLGSDKVNVRAGPGVRYPVIWVYIRRGLPVEIVAEFELFRKVRDSDGTEGWVHKSLLSGKRTVLIRGAVRTLYRDADSGSPPVLLAEPGVQAQLIACRDDWCQVEMDGYRGYARQDWLYGVYPGEQVD